MYKGSVTLMHFAMHLGRYLDDLEADKHSSLGVERLHSFAEGCRAQEVHHLHTARQQTQLTDLPYCLLHSKNPPQTVCMPREHCCELV